MRRRSASMIARSSARPGRVRTRADILGGNGFVPLDAYYLDDLAFNGRAWSRSRRESRLDLARGHRNHGNDDRPVGERSHPRTEGRPSSVHRGHLGFRGGLQCAACHGRSFPKTVIPSRCNFVRSLATTREPRQGEASMRNSLFDPERKGFATLRWRATTRRQSPAHPWARPWLRIRDVRVFYRR